MAVVTLRYLPDWLFDRNKCRAGESGLSLEFTTVTSRAGTALRPSWTGTSTKSALSLWRAARRQTVVPEEKQLEAEVLFLLTTPLAAPRLIASEVATAISKKVRLKNLPGREAKASLALCLEHLIPMGRPILYDDEQPLAGALDLSVKLNHQMPDCIYLAPARKLNARLVTAARPGCRSWRRP